MDPFLPKEGYGQLIADNFGTPTVIQIDERRVMKTSYSSPSEIETMKFVAENTTIPVPRVFDAQFSHDPMKQSHIVMEFMPGQQLEKVWLNLTHDQKVKVCSQLGGYVSQLRSLKGTRIEAVNGYPITAGQYVPRTGGPFETEKEFVEFLFDGMRQRRMSKAREFYLRTGLGDGHDMKFTHGDLFPRNILVDDNACITAVLDWDRAGWLPAYYEHWRLLTSAYSEGAPDFGDYLHYILPHEYVTEVMALSELLEITEGFAVNTHRGKPLSRDELVA